MKLYRRIVFVLVPDGYELPEMKRYNRAWYIADIVQDEKRIEQYEAEIENPSCQYYIGAYESPSMANFAIGYVFYKEEEE